MAIKDGGQAFPGRREHEVSRKGEYGITEIDTREEPVAGMSLRDYFAGQALANGWRQMFESEEGEFLYGDIARSCYEMADAMLKAREQEQK